MAVGFSSVYIKGFVYMCTSPIALRSRLDLLLTVSELKILVSDHSDHSDVKEKGDQGKTTPMNEREEKGDKGRSTPTNEREVKVDKGKRTPTNESIVGEDNDEQSMDVGSEGPSDTNIDTTWTDESNLDKSPRRDVFVIDQQPLLLVLAFYMNDVHAHLRLDKVFITPKPSMLWK